MLHPCFECKEAVKGNRRHQNFGRGGHGLTPPPPLLYEIFKNGELFVYKRDHNHICFELLL